MFRGLHFSIEGTRKSRCQFVDSDDMIIDQIIEGCYSTDLRKKLLTEEKTLLEILQLGKTMEEVQQHAKEYDKTPPLIPVQALVQKGTNRPFFQRPGDQIGSSFRTQGNATTVIDQDTSRKTFNDVQPEV